MGVAAELEERSARLSVRSAKDGHQGSHVLYWMTSSRRTNYNLALQHAVDLAVERNLPLLVVEALAIGHRWASDRIHTFVLQGMIDQRTNILGSGVAYVPYVETRHGEARGLLARMSVDADALVIDDYPTYMPRQVAQRAQVLAPCEVHLVDSNGFIAMRHAGRAFTTAYSLRRHLHKTIEDHLADMPVEFPLAPAIGLPDVDERLIDLAFKETDTPRTPLEFIWRTAEGNRVGTEALKALDIDHEVAPVPHMKGGSMSAHKRWRKFLDARLERYHEDRNHPDLQAATGLSPWLHFGHISSHQMVKDVLDIYGWDPGHRTPPPDGRRSGWWGLPAGPEAFLDQVITWRDLAFIHAHMVHDHDGYSSIPEWAQATLAEHANDPRPGGYTFEQLETAQTGDALWNAAQRQLMQDGIIQNYLRMLWGKKILEWAPTPQMAFDWMVALNDRWALDGRDPNSYAGIGWVCGKFDRGWTERAVFGKVRCMMSHRTEKKVKAREYIARYGPARGQLPLGASYRMPPRRDA